MRLENVKKFLGGLKNSSWVEEAIGTTFGVLNLNTIGAKRREFYLQI